MCKSILIKTVIFSLALSSTTMLVGCYYPKAADDFTVLKNDVLSHLVRDSYGNGSQTGGDSYGLNGPGRLDKSRLTSLSDRLFLGKERNDIEAKFVKNDGECAAAVMQDEMTCSFVRTWKLKNIGAPFDISNWSNPAAKITMIFAFDEHGKARNLSVKITDATVYKELRDKK